MPDGTTTLIQAVGEWLKYIFVALLGMFGWNLKRQVKRIDTLEEDKVDQHAIDKIETSMTIGFDRVSHDIKDLHDELRKDILHIHDRIDKGLDKKP